MRVSILFEWIVVMCDVNSTLLGVLLINVTTLLTNESMKPTHLICQMCYDVYYWFAQLDCPTVVSRNEARNN